MDRSSRRIIGWSKSLKNDDELVVRALKDTISTRGYIPSDSIHHSDRGSTYESHRYKNLLSAYGTKSSMNAKGNCYDNAAMGSFIGRYKTTNVRNFEFTTFEEIRSHVVDYIELFYNRFRKHTSILDITPVQFE